jgi:DNA-binding transcriptional ArsR family regulator
MATLSEAQGLGAGSEVEEFEHHLGSLELDGEVWTAASADPLVPHNLDLIELAAVLQALSDPIRLRIVARLADGHEYTCGSFELPVGKSTCSHHFRVLREAGVVEQRIDGKCRFNRLRSEQLEQRFPGLLRAVLAANQV